LAVVAMGTGVAVSGTALVEEAEADRVVWEA